MYLYFKFIFRLNKDRAPFDQKINCEKIIYGDKLEIIRAKYYTNFTLFNKNNHNYVEVSKNCSKLVFDRGYITENISKTENEFPLAFSILIYKDVKQFERLLRAIYRPHNIYCVHVDKNASEDVKAGVHGVTSCFSNVFVPRDCVDVEWGTASVLEAEFVCMQHLLKENKKWRLVHIRMMYMI